MMTRLISGAIITVAIVLAGFFMLRNNGNQIKLDKPERLKSSSIQHQDKLTSTGAKPNDFRQHPDQSDRYQPKEITDQNQSFDAERDSNEVWEQQFANLEDRMALFNEVFTTEEQEKIRNLLEKRGYFGIPPDFSDEVYNAYFQYDNETLNELARFNDIRALNILGFRAQQSGNLDAAFDHHFQAAAVGSLEDLREIENIYDQRLTANLRQTDPKEFKKLKLEKIAWQEVFRKRGGFLERSTPGYPPESLSEEEKAVVEELSKEYYQKLESKRQEKGLEPFDNSVPDLLKEYNNLMSGPL